MNDEEVEVTFRFPRVHLKEAVYSRTVEDYKEMAMYVSGASAIEHLLCAQVLEWQKTQKHVVTPNTPAGADVIYTDKRGEEHPAVLVAHLRNAQAWIWVSSDPTNYLLKLIKLEDLRLAEEDEG